MLQCAKGCHSGPQPSTGNTSLQAMNQVVTGVTGHARRDFTCRARCVQVRFVNEGNESFWSVGSALRQHDRGPCTETANSTVTRV
jgi:hypothetical protein